MMADDGIRLAGEAPAFAPHRRLDLANEHDFQLGEFRVRPAYREVRRGDVIDILEPRVMQVLAALARRMGAVVSRDELLRDCWGDVSVTDDSLHRCIGRLRKLAERDGGRSFVIETVPRVGYRLVVAGAPAESAPVMAPAAAAQASTPRLRRAWLAAAGAGLILSGLAGAAFWALTRPETWRVAGFESLVDTQRAERHPSLAAGGGLLAYTAGLDDGPRDILLRNIRDGSTDALLAGPADDLLPALSPAGDRLAFVRAIPGQPCQILTKALPAGPERPLAACRGEELSRLAWSPDGRRLYFTDRPGPTLARRIYAVGGDGGAVSQVTRPADPERGDLEPAVSPDGRRLAFVRWKTIGVADIFVQDLASGRLRRVTDDSAEIIGLAWSPSGRSLFFSSNRSGDYGLWSVPASGGAPTRLGAGLREVRRLAAGPDGRLAMELADIRANLAQAGGPEPGRPISDQAGVQWAGDISATGALAYIADTRSGRSLWVRPAGQPEQKLTFFAATHFDDVRWSPDGRRLIFVAARGGIWSLYEIAASGGGARALVSGDYEIFSPAFTPDGRALVYAAKHGGVWRLWRLDLAPGSRPRAVSGPGWAAVRATPEGLLAVKESAPGIWRLGAGGPQLVVREMRRPTNAWTIAGDRQYWIDLPRGQPPRILSAPLAGGPASVVGTAPDAAMFTGLAVDPRTRAMVYTRVLRHDVDIGQMRLENAR